MVILSEYIGEKVSIHFDKKTPGEMVKDYIDKNFNKKISLYGLSSLLHYSTVSITEHFRKEFGTTVTKYVLNKRVEYSKKLLLDRALTIKEVAEKSCVNILVSSGVYCNEEAFLYGKEYEDGYKSPGYLKELDSNYGKILKG